MKGGLELYTCKKPESLVVNENPGAGLFRIERDKVLVMSHLLFWLGFFVFHL
jgi:hypothetical protein